MNSVASLDRNDAHLHSAFIPGPRELPGWAQYHSYSGTGCRVALVCSNCEVGESYLSRLQASVPLLHARRPSACRSHVAPRPHSSTESESP